jgi:hypothetical protein
MKTSKQQLPLLSGKRKKSFKTSIKDVFNDFQKRYRKRNNSKGKKFRAKVLMALII